MKMRGRRRRRCTGGVGDTALTSGSQPDRRTLGPARTIVTRSRSKTSGGFFRLLPQEVFNAVLDKLSVQEISVFSMVSKDINSYIVDYISTMAWKNKTIIQNLHHSTYLEKRSATGHYRNLGLLFKRCTLLLPTKERLKFIFSKFSKIPCLMLEQCPDLHCTGLSSYGVFLSTLTAGWAELDCQTVFSFLCDITNLLQKTEAVISAKPGVMGYQELQLRLFCRQVLLDPWMNQPECQFWLMQLLTPWPLVSQAHLLLILYGPLLPEGSLGWQDLVEGRLPLSALWDLARAITFLFGKLQVKGWNAEFMLAILDELTVIPEPWHVENVARLLVLCGSSLCYTVLARKALTGRCIEISRLIVYITLVCEKDGYHMGWVVKLVQKICKVFNTDPERFCFIRQLETMFSGITREYFELTAAGNHLEYREAFQTLCILLDSSAHFHTKLIHMFLKEE